MNSMSNYFSPQVARWGVVALIGALAACGQKADPAATAPVPVKSAVTQQIEVPTEMAGRFAVSTLELKDLESIQEVAGRIEANERKVTRTGASVTGRVMDIMVDIGDRVSAGQVLATVASPELASAQMAYLRAHSAATLAQKAVDRARQLFQADVIGAAELQKREAEQSLAQAEQRAVHDQLRLMGMPAGALVRLAEQGTLHPHANVVASQSGVVIERKVSQGQVAQPGDPLFTIADLSNVWVVGDLPEQIARSVKVGQKVDIHVPALGASQLSGKIVYVGDTVSAETRTVPIRTQLENPGRELKPQMLVTMRIRGESRQAVTVPQEAVIRENDRDHVYVQVAKNTYRYTPVTLAPPSGGVHPVQEGLRPGDQVVVQGAFHLHNERKRSELE